MDKKKTSSKRERIGKEKANFWLDSEVKELLAIAAEREGVNMTQMLRKLILRNAIKEGMVG